MPAAMPIVANAETQLGVVSSPVISARTPEEQQAYVQHKARKKYRKRERLLFFFGWCEGCRSYGNSV